MVIAKTPLRIPLAGGLSDLREYADQWGGVTLSATIDKYIYVAVKRNYDNDYELHYLNTHEKVDESESIRHNHIREAIKICGLQKSPLDLSIMNDMPHEGGLGSSGALTAALLSALYAFKDQWLSEETIITAASMLEMDILEGASGYHDHAITHLGGFRFLNYKNQKITSEELSVSNKVIKSFKDRLMLFYSGYHAKTKPSLALLAQNLHSVVPQIDEIKKNAYNLLEALRLANIDEAGECIQVQQDIKQKLPGHFENEFVLETMKKARKLGVFAQIPGGKIGSFLLIYRPKGIDERKVLRYFSNLTHIPFGLSSEGTRVVKI